MKARMASRSQQFSAVSVLSQVVLFALALFASSVLFAQAGANYYVSTKGNDHNRGTFAEPWLTIRHAANTAAAGATVHVMGGVYRQSITFPKSGTRSQPITFTSYPGQMAVIDGAGLKPSGVQGLINITNQNYITINGFEIRNYTTGNAAATPTGVWITGHGTGIQILNNLVHHITTKSEKNGNAFGISVYGSSKTPITHLVISGNEVYDLKTGNSESVNVDGNVTHFEITNNLIHDNDNIGIDAIGYEGVGPVGYDEAMYGEISGNTIYNISGIKNPGEGRSYDADGLYCDGCAYVTFENNVIFQADYGIETTSENQVCLANGTEWSGGNSGSGTAAKGTSPCYGRYATVRNNLFYHANSCGVSMGGYAKATSKGGHSNGGGSSYADVFVNNTLYDNGTQRGSSMEGTPSGDFQIQYQVGSAQGNYFENNVVYSGSPNIWINSFVPASTSYPGPPATLNWNLYNSSAGYVKGTSILWDDVASFASFANYQSLAGEDADSVNADPQFVNLGAVSVDLDIQSTSPAFQSGGTRLSCSVGWCDPHGSSRGSIYGATDLSGNPRTTNGRINMGAYQSTGINNSLTVILAAGTYLLKSGQSTTLTAAVSANPGGAGVPSGTVNFMLGSNLLQTSILLPTSATTSAVSLPLSASQLAPGANTLTAVYSGNSITPCCNPTSPRGGGTPLPVYPSETSAAITVTVQQ
ncbi:MAG: Ig-like domain repeat protein [Terriglobales bacterium]